MRAPFRKFSAAERKAYGQLQRAKRERENDRNSAPKGRKTPRGHAWR